MRHGKYDKIINFTLIIMVMIAAVQTAFLWSGGLYGGGLRLFAKDPTAAERAETMDRTAVTDELFQPFNLILSSSAVPEKLMLNRSEENYGRVWSEMREYIKLIYDSKTETIDKSQWPLISNGKGLIAEFKLNIPTDVLSWFFDGRKLPGGEIDGLTAFMISLTGSSEKADIYLMDSKEIHKLTVPYKSLSKDAYDDIIGDTYAETERIRYTSAVRAGGLLIRDGLLAESASPAVDVQYPTLSYSVPEALAFNSTADDIKIRSIAATLLGGEKYSYEMDISKSGMVIMANFNSIYYLNDKGFLEYEYKATQAGEKDKGSVDDAFAKALEFIYGNGRRNLTSRVYIYMTGFTENKNSYTFTFDYIVRSDRTVPIYLDCPTISAAGEIPVRNAIKVMSNGAGVLRAQWLMKKFENKGYSTLRSGFTQADIDTLIGSRIAVLNSANAIVTDMRAAYVIGGDQSDSAGISPARVVVTDAAQYRYIYAK